MMVPLTRRTVTAMLTSGLAISAVPHWLAATASAAGPPTGLAFNVFLGKQRIGQHATRFAPDGDGFRATTKIELKVKLAFITLLDLKHESEEAWQAGRLAELKSRTNDGGDVFEVSGEATSAGFRVRGPAGSITAPSNVHTSNGLWNVAALESKQLVDAQNGGVIGLVVKRLDSGPIDVAGRSVLAQRYSILTPVAAGDLWFDDIDLAKARLEIRGEIVDYRLIA